MIISGLQIKSELTTIKFFLTAHHAQSKSVAVASIADTHAHATTTHLLSPPTKFQLKNMKKIKLAIAEDNEKFRNAIMRLIHLENDLQVVLQAENGKGLLEQLKTITPDIILMDIRMPEMDGIEASIRVKELYPNIKIIAFSQYDQEANIVEMNIHGVKSFIGKEDDPEELFKAIRIVNDGGVYMTDRSAKIVQSYLSKIVAPQKYKLKITEQEKILIKDVASGLSSKQIGQKIGKSHRTVDDMREKLYQKYGVANKEQFIVRVTKLNLDDL